VVTFSGQIYWINYFAIHGQEAKGREVADRPNSKVFPGQNTENEPKRNQPHIHCTWATRFLETPYFWGCLLCQVNK